MTRTTIVLVAIAAAASGSLADQTRSLERHYQVSPSQRIELNGFSGSEIEFKSWDKNEVSIRMEVRISASDERYENDYIKALDIQETHTDKEFVISSKELNRGVSANGFWSLFSGRAFVKKEIRGVVYVPRSNSLTTDFSYGSVTLEEMKGDLTIYGKSNKILLRNCTSIQKIENDYGTTEIENSGGTLKLSGTSSTVTISSFAGTASVEANYSTVRLKGVDRPVKVQCQSGKITAEDIGGDLTLRADYSSINVSRIKGLLDVESKSGTLRAQDIKGLVVDAPYATVEVTTITGIPGKQVSVSGQSGSITLESVSGDIVVNSPYSPISLTGIQGSINVSTKSGRVTADDVTGDFECRSEYSAVSVRGLRAKSVIVTDKSSNVDLSLLVVPAKINVRNEYGGVRVSIPKGFSGDIALDAEYGSVETNFDVRKKNSGSAGYAIGKVGNGTGSISIETKSGNIELNEK